MVIGPGSRSSRVKAMDLYRIVTMVRFIEKNVKSRVQKSFAFLFTSFLISFTSQHPWCRLFPWPSSLQKAKICLFSMTCASVCCFVPLDVQKALMGWCVEGWKFHLFHLFASTTRIIEYLDALRLGKRISSTCYCSRSNQNPRPKKPRARNPLPQFQLLLAAPGQCLTFKFFFRMSKTCDFVQSKPRKH